MKLSAQIATRARSLDFFTLGAVLPNPDPILKAQGQDIRVYGDLRADAHVGGCCRRRKSAVKALEWGFEREGAGARLHNNLEALFADIDLERLIGDCMESVFYGYAPIETIWARAGGLIVPGELRALPQDWFLFDVEGQLRFRTRQAPFEGEALPPRKFLLPRQDASYANPYGFPDLSMVFWPQVFKKGGMKFWLSFTEKFGTPWIVGKLPSGTPQGEMDDLADRLEEMVQDAIAVVPDTSEIEALQVGGTASADLYEKLVLHCRSEVSIALLGSNMGMEKDSNRATAGAGLDVAEDLRDGDAEIVCAAVNQLAGWICDLNGWAGPRPVWRLWDQEKKDRIQAERDKTVTEAGAALTPVYFRRAYGYADDEIKDAPEAGPPGNAPVSAAGFPGKPLVEPQFADGGVNGLPPNYADQAAATLATDAAPAVRQWLATIRAMLDSADSLEEFRARLLAAYPDLDSAHLAAAIGQAVTAAALAGRYDIAIEAGLGPGSGEK